MKRNWFVVLACCVINLLVLGCGRIAPVYYVECITRYNTTRSAASLPFVLCFVLRTLPGPLAGFLGQKCGLKETTIFGCALSFAGIFLCYFAEDIIVITVMFGIIFGLGFGLSSSLLPSILNDLFQENQTKANGFSLAGTCLGALIFPPLCKLLIDYYGVSSSFLILSAIVLNSIPASMLLKNPQFISSNFTNKRSTGCTNISSQINSTEEKNKTVNKMANGISLQIQNSENNSSSKNVKIWKENSVEKFQNSEYECKSNHSANKTYLLTIKNLDTMTEDANLPFSQLQNSIPKNNKQKDSCFEMFRVIMNPVFILIATYQGLFCFTLVCVNTIIIDVAHDKNISGSTDVYFLLCIALSDLFGRTCLGFFTDGNYFSRTNYTAVCFNLAGAIFVMIVFSASFACMMSLVFLFYAISGSLIAVFPVAISEFIPKEHSTMAMASRLFLLGPFSLAVPPLIGYFRDSYGSYDWILYITAISCLICSGLTIFTYRMAKRNKNINVLDKQ